MSKIIGTAMKMMVIALVAVVFVTAAGFAGAYAEEGAIAKTDGPAKQADPAAPGDEVLGIRHLIAKPAEGSFLQRKAFVVVKCEDDFMLQIADYYYPTNLRAKGIGVHKEGRRKWMQSLKVDFGKEMVIAASASAPRKEDRARRRGHGGVGGKDRKRVAPTRSRRKAFMTIESVKVAQGKLHVRCTFTVDTEIDRPYDLVACPRRDLPVVFHYHEKVIVDPEAAARKVKASRLLNDAHVFVWKAAQSYRGGRAEEVAQHAAQLKKIAKALADLGEADTARKLRDNAELLALAPAALSAKAEAILNEVRKTIAAEKFEEAQVQCLRAMERVRCLARLLAREEARKFWTQMRELEMAIRNKKAPAPPIEPLTKPVEKPPVAEPPVEIF